MRTLLVVWALSLLASVGWAQSGDTSASDLLTELTLEQKVGQLLLVYHSPAPFLAEHGFGGSLVMESMLRDPVALQESLTAAQELCSVPLLVAMDQEGGQINRLRPLPGFEEVASAEEMSTWIPDSVRTYVRPVARKMNELGINTNLAPVLDPAVNVDFQATLMKSRQRAFGNDTGTIVPWASNFMRGFADQGVLCVVKHFPGYAVSENSDHEVAESLADRSALLGYVHPFAVCMEQAGAVMMSSINFSFVSDRPAVFDSSLVALARCGFNERVVMTDDLWGTALRSWVSDGPVERADYPDEDLQRLTLLSFDAGNDMLMITYPAKAVMMKEILIEAVRTDPERQARLDESVLRILQLKKRLGILK